MSILRRPRGGASYKPGISARRAAWYKAICYIIFAFTTVVTLILNALVIMDLCLNGGRSVDVDQMGWLGALLLDVGWVMFFLLRRSDGSSPFASILTRIGEERKLREEWEYDEKLHTTAWKTTTRSIDD